MAWFLAAHLAYLTEKCPREPRLRKAEDALVCYILITFIIICVDQLNIPIREWMLDHIF